MLHVHDINDLGHPELWPYLTLRQEAEHRKRGIFLAEGEKVSRRLLESGLEVVSLLLPQHWLDNLRPLIEQHGGEMHAFVAPKPELQKLTGVSMFQGVTTVGRVPPARSLAELLEERRPIHGSRRGKEADFAAKSDRPPPHVGGYNASNGRLLVAIDDLTGGDNVGTVVRNAAAFDADALLVGETCCSPWLRKAVRTSMGTVFKLPVVETGSLALELQHLRQRGFKIVAAHAHTEQTTLSGCDLTGDVCLVMGGEGHGIRESILVQCDAHAIVPMANGVDSLNVGSAASVFLYEAARQRGRV